MIYQLDMTVTASFLAEAIHGELRGEDCILSRFSIDSRDQNTGGLFFCIRGERFDGHDFAAMATENGAVCVVTDHDCAFCAPCEIRVQNTERALGDMASAYLSALSPFTVAVTGSVGKTTTKQFIAAMLSAHMPTHYTQGNFNNQIGLPLTVLSTQKQHKAAVLELGMNHAGEIGRLSEICRPDIAVITNIGNSHIEYLGSREGIRDAKMEIARGLRANGILLLNGDEPLLSGIPGARYVSAFNKEADYYLCNIRQGELGSTFDLHTKQGVLRDLHIHALGTHNVFDAAIACAVGQLMGLDEVQIRRGLLAFSNTGMRQKIYKKADVTVIEDCYNASPESMQAAISVLCDRRMFPQGRRIAVLGDMRELGTHSRQLHAALGEGLHSAGVDILFTFGEEAAHIASAAVQNGMQEENVFTFRDSSHVEDIGMALREIIQKGDTVLFKASRAMELERLLVYVNP